MRVKQASDNGNVTFNPPEAASEAFNENRSWLAANPDSNPYENRTDNSSYNPHCNAIYSSIETTEAFINYSTATEIRDSKPNVEFVVCNRQYRINAQNNINCTHSLPKVNILEESNEIEAVGSTNVGDPNVYSDDTPIEDDRVFDHSDTDDMSEKGVHPVPRGIVNPNYPGFQHLAHTLQDYSSNIEHFYQSENDMTDDDVDIEITDLACEPENNQIIRTSECKNINNNNVRKDKTPKKDFCAKSISLDSSIQHDIPDLIKNISKNYNNNGNDSLNFDINCTDTDIENNFNTKDIIGDFNKEVEDEIKHLLNYNINIQDDLEELRRDIKDTFAKPIENTINNISDVVNHVIKKLVETNVDIIDAIDVKSQPLFNEESSEIIKENEKNTWTEMNLSRPTFLFIDKNTDHKINDAILSDGKDEINISEYDPEKLSQNVENTIKQLSTELRKIIPKLDEMREQDRLWADRKNEIVSVKDGNSNDIGNSSSSYNSCSTVNTRIKTEVSKNCKYNDNHPVLRSSSKKSPVYSDSKTVNDREKEVTSTKNCYHSAQSNTSVRNNDGTKDLNLGSFDVYNIETALPKLDIDAIENHLRAAKEAERRKRNDREEIRRRLAMGAEAEEYHSLGHTDRPGKKPSLHSRLQSGAKLRPSSLTKSTKSRSTHSLGHTGLKESDFYALQATLQTEARMALAQAKEMARVQMERERRARAVSPVTEMLRRGMEKASAPLAPDRRRVSRQLLTDMNVAQLQVIVNELHSQIESLNESLVKLLMARDELHMGQDSMLVDIEDLTRYLGVKEQTKKTKGAPKTGMKRLTSLVQK